MLKRIGFFTACGSACALLLAACGDRGGADQAALEPGAVSGAADGLADGVPGAEDGPPGVTDEAAPQGPPPPPYDPEQDYGDPDARADFEFAEAGTGAATAWFFEAAVGVRVYVRARDMAPGSYAVHVHETGDCTPPDFVSAGDHLGVEAGIALETRPDDFEAGMLPDIVVGEDGDGTLTAMLDVVEFTADTDATWPLFDADGAAIVIHRFATAALPPGEDNPRIACGEIFESDL